MNNEQLVIDKKNIFFNSEKLVLFITKVLIIAGICCYIFFSLVPDSHSLMVLFPFVSFWQIGILIPMLLIPLLLWQKKIYFIGNGFDWLMGLIGISLIVASIFAYSPQHSIWYSIAASSFLTIVYLIHSFLKTSCDRKNILIKQGYINVSFIIISLTLWVTETLLPELSRLATFKAQGINKSFNFSTIELRNWSPIGHQNYVAGYLLLCLPLLLALIIIDRNKKRRWWWIIGLGLGLIDLYTTSSRGGWLGFGVMIILALTLALFFSKIPRLWIGVGGIISVGILIVSAIANQRLLNLITALLQGKAAGELAYRTINAIIGWNMAKEHLFTGIGLGNVPLLYQKYRPVWAGRESELAFQLHSTPVQLWAEMGLLAVICGLGTIGIFTLLISKLFTRQIQLTYLDTVILFCILISLVGYSVMSLIDYQLDNISISGTITLYVAVIASIFNTDRAFITNKTSKLLSFSSIGIIIALIVWLIPVHRAWQFSSQGFNALTQQNTDRFIAKLTQANKLASWEAYYPYQLGWNLAEIATKNRDSNQIQQAISWFEKANTISPYREFGHTNLAWLLLNTNPSQATQEFVTSARLVPAKRGVFFGLGISLLAQQKNDLATEAFVLEILRNPLLLTSPIWRSPLLQKIYPQIIKNLETKYNLLLKQDPNNKFWHKSFGSFYWWIGNLNLAKQHWQQSPTLLQDIALNINSESKLKTQLETISPSPIKSLLLAWFNPEQRQEQLQQAWLQTNYTNISPQLLQQLTMSMENSSNFAQWLYNAPAIPYRRERAGFGVVNRHIDGSIPQDFYLVVENSAIATWFKSFYLSPVYNPDIDMALQPQRNAFISSLNL